MWDGPDDVRIVGSRKKKTVRARIIREVGGQVVGMRRTRKDVIWYVGEAAPMAIDSTWGQYPLTQLGEAVAP